jgi:hypothetical protein
MDALMLAVATALATKAAEATAGTAWAALVARVRASLHRHPDAAKALAEAEATPEDERQIRALANQLAAVAKAEPEFSEQLRSLWDSAKPELSSSTVRNTISGSVYGSSIQAGSIVITTGIPPTVP